MSHDVLALDQRNLRGTDSNSLLRLYDLANAVFHKSPSQQERTRADKAIQRIARELQRRKVPLSAGHEPAVLGEEAGRSSSTLTGK
jgi:hypothetical protein